MVKAKKTGTLYIVGTPIGNLKDITLRALETLKEVDLIAAEDTRHTQKLLNHYAIVKPVTSYFEHNKVAKGAWLLEKLKEGANIALVSDAGMPGISDPGADLVKACLHENIPLTVIPGPSAILTALVASGLDCSGFVFVGFFPRLKKEKKKIFAELREEKRTLVFYESPNRLLTTLGEIKEAWGERYCCVARELTKIYEEYRRGTVSEQIGYWQDHPPKGEITLLVEGAKTEDLPTVTPEKIIACYQDLMVKGLSSPEALKETAKLLNVPKREVYQILKVK